MKAVSFGGNVFRIYDETLKVYDKLPAGNYIVRFSEMQGFYLEVYSEFEIKEQKVYGVHINKIEKVMKAFGITNRNLGIILSGDKGIGKSLFAKLLCKRAVSANYPVIVVDTYYPEIASYIDSIEQEVVVLFDEFDKTFGEVRANDGQASPQTNLLSLFDGVSAGKKMYIITCNSIYKINEFLVNRPGRFHYHFRFMYPCDEEITQYLQDSIEEKYWAEIDKVITFARRIKLNYDCLRSIAFELNMGESFEDAINDLNILHIDDEKYDIEIKFTNGLTITKKDHYMNLMSFSYENIDVYDETIHEEMYIKLKPVDFKFDAIERCFYMDGHSIIPEYDSYVYKEQKEATERKIEKITVRLSETPSLHYIV